MQAFSRGTRSQLSYAQNMKTAMFALVAALALSGCTSQPSVVTPPPGPPTPPPAGGAACPATITIGPGNTYNPSSCTIKVAAQVTISANGGHPLSGSGLKTVSSAKTDQTLSFAAPGVFTFACDFHGGSGMTGKITVEQ
jgi:plastocyanin